MLNLLITFTILIVNQSPDSTLVRKIHFRGNQSIKSSLLSKIISTRAKEPLFEITLDKDTANIRILYASQGFRQASIKIQTTTGSKGKQVYFYISEGPRTKIESINIKGNSSFPRKKIQGLVKLKKNDDLIINNISLARKAIEQFYKNSGYPYATVESQIDYVANSAIITFNITEGTIAYIKNISSRGNIKISERIIRITTEIKRGEKFSLERLEKARQRLYATQLFERASFYILAPPHTDSLNIRFDVIELPSRSIGLGIGFQTPPTGLLISGEWQHLNFLSRRHNLFLSSSYTPAFNGNWQSESKGSYRINYLFDTPINLILQPSFKYEKIESLKQDELNIEAGISRYLGPKLEIGTYLRYLRVWTNYPLSFTSDYRSITNSQNLYLRIDTRNKIFTPSSGIFFTTNLQYAGSILDGDNDFYKNQTELIYFSPFLPQLVIGIRSLAGICVPYGRSILVPYYETFTLGGNNGLRGYTDKSIGPTVIGNQYHYGEAIINTNLELRSNFEKIFDFVVFFDAGKVTDHAQILSFKKELLNYSAGCGMRINTPFGPIRLDYAKRLKDSPAGDWGKFHLGLLNIF